MPVFRGRAREVQAMLFLGSPASALEVIAWAHAIAPDIVVRERIEYFGWADREGHVELEIRDVEEQAGAGDWLVCIETSGESHFEVLADDAFRQNFETVR